jgi:hypothetical protein
MLQPCRATRAALDLTPQQLSTTELVTRLRFEMQPLELWARVRNSGFPGLLAGLHALRRQRPRAHAEPLAMRVRVVHGSSLPSRSPFPLPRPEPEEPTILPKSGGPIGQKTRTFLIPGRGVALKNSRPA